MKIALIGATGNIGSRVLNEALTRGHSVTAIARKADALAARPGLTAKAADLHQPAALAPVLAGHDAVVSAVHFLASDFAKLLAAVRQSGVKRWLMVGGAGSLEVAPGLKLIDAPGFPEIYKAEAAKGGEFLDALKAQAADLEWSFLSPSAMIVPGERTGKFRLGKDTLLSDANGDSRISMEDYAIALIDELESPKHIRQRFTVGY
ncbi:NAD(P)-dependent oxidoreductase [Ferrovibrio terrae]|uniref:NAD(P)-dependent oxidoreductase n=1 Tax=Ferrovibrio terrae TaxID=2594003 RepID=UPI003137C983